MTMSRSAAFCPGSARAAAPQAASAKRSGPSAGGGARLGTPRPRPRRARRCVRGCPAVAVRRTSTWRSTAATTAGHPSSTAYSPSKKSLPGARTTIEMVMPASTSSAAAPGSERSTRCTPGTAAMASAVALPAGERADDLHLRAGIDGEVRLWPSSRSCMTRWITATVAGCPVHQRRAERPWIPRAS